VESDIDESVDPILQAQKLAYRYGLKPEELYDLTYWDLVVYTKAVQERRQQVADQQQELDLVASYRTIAYLAMAMSKRGLPPISIELEKLRAGSSDELSPEASVDAMRSWIGKNAKSKSEREN